MSSIPLALRYVPAHERELLKQSEYNSYLRKKIGLNTVVAEQARLLKRGIPPIIPMEKNRTAEDFLLDLLEQQKEALRTAKVLLPKADDTSKFVQSLGGIQNLQVWNRFSKGFAKDVEANFNVKTITPAFLKNLWDRYLSVIRVQIAEGAPLDLKDPYAAAKYRQVLENEAIQIKKEVEEFKNRLDPDVIKKIVERIDTAVARGDKKDLDEIKNKIVAAGPFGRMGVDVEDLKELAEPPPYVPSTPITLESLSASPPQSFVPPAIETTPYARETRQEEIQRAMLGGPGSPPVPVFRPVPQAGREEEKEEKEEAMSGVRSVEDTLISRAQNEIIPVLGREAALERIFELGGFQLKPILLSILDNPSEVARKRDVIEKVVEYLLSEVEKNNLDPDGAARSYALVLLLVSVVTDKKLFPKNFLPGDPLLKTFLRKLVQKQLPNTTQLSELERELYGIIKPYYDSAQGQGLSKKKRKRLTERVMIGEVLAGNTNRDLIKKVKRMRK